MLMDLRGGLWLRVSFSVLEEVVGGGQRAPLSSDGTRSAWVHWLLCHSNSFNGCPGRQCQGIMVPKQPLGLRSCLSPGGRGPGAVGRGGARRREKWPWARGARRWCHCWWWWRWWPHSQHFCRWNQRSPVSCSGGTVVGLGAATGRWGGEGEESRVLSLHCSMAGSGPIVR